MTRRDPRAADGGRFDRLVLRNVRCFRDATIELDPQLTVLIGENGAGKTTAVEALASLTHGADEGLAGFPLSRQSKSGEVALYEKGGAEALVRWRAGGRAKRRRLPADRYLFAYGRYRRVYFLAEPVNEAASFSSPERDLDELARRASGSRSATLFRPDNHLLRDLSRYLAALHFHSRSDSRLAGVWTRLVESLQRLQQGIQGIEMARGKTGYIPQVMRNGVPLELRELSDGYQAVLVVIFDLVLRYVFLFAELEDPLLGTAMVAIDEVDLHLHPRWQRTVVRQLTTLFPNTQFLLTTHSAAVVQGAIDGGKRVVVLRDESGAATARTLTAKESKQLVGAEVESLLLEEKLFGLDSRYSPRFSEVEQRVAEMQQRIAKGLASDVEVQQLFADLGKLQELMMADEIRRADSSFLSQMAGLRMAFLEDLATQAAKSRTRP